MNSTKIVIISCNQKSTTEKLYNQFASAGYSPSVIASGCDKSQIPDCDDMEITQNIWWSGCWQKAIDQCLEESVLWVIGGDIELLCSPHEYIQSIESSMPFGLWSPSIEGNAHEYMCSKPGVINRVKFLEGICMAISKRFIRDLGGILPYSSFNYIGWGTDVLLSIKSRIFGYENILDGGVSVYHPDTANSRIDTLYNFAYGYQAEARTLMTAMFVNEFGLHYEQQMGWREHPSMEFAENMLEENMIVHRKLEPVL